MQGETRDRMHEQRLAERRAAIARGPRSYIGASMGTNGSGTNSVKPPLRTLLFARAQKVPRPAAGDSTWPNIIVTFERNPTRWAAPCTASHCSVVTLSGQMTCRTSSSRISAAVPGQRAEAGVAELRQIIVER